MPGRRLIRGNIQARITMYRLLRSLNRTIISLANKISRSFVTKIWDFTIRRRDSTRTSKTTIVLVGKTKTLLVHFTFLVHFFAVSARLRREIA